uniref:Uncharacterized protein n=1 Tax=Hippocampus comes TaxID=109280 RepID=A0A3Q2YDQ1_HIPCM
WTPWGHCSVSCGAGLLSRYRFCSRGKLNCSQNPCPGESDANRLCTDLCRFSVFPVSGSWCDWSTWTPCSRTCGAESVSRYRSCGCPEPKAGGQPCPGEQEIHNGVVHGSWSSWSAWSACDGCDGFSNRTRDCNSPPARFGGLPCLGESMQTGVLHCHPLPGCYVDGGWGQWAIWSSCSVSCGGGVHFRRRQCDNPSPQSGGRGCLGIGEQQRDCNTHLCTGIRACSLCSRWFSLFTHFVKLNMMSACYFLETGFLPMQFTDSQKCMLLLSETLMRMYHFVLTLDTVGPWRPWSQWSVCSVSCGGGQQSRFRMCGTHLLNSWTVVHVISLLIPVDGGWTPWSVWSDCSETCGQGTQVQTRACINPPPRNNGSHCDGPERQNQECHAAPCLGL